MLICVLKRRQLYLIYNKKEEATESESNVSFLKKSALAAILVTFAIVAFSATASAAVINVPAGYTTIQEAINAVDATNRTIEVNATAYAGTTETVVVNRSDIIIRSVNGRAVVSAGGADDHVVNITDQTNVTLEGFEIRDATGTTNRVAGIFMHNASDCNISDNSVTNISATGYNAYGICLGDSNNNTFSSSTIYNLDSGHNAYGIALYEDDVGAPNDNSFSSGSISEINAPTWWDFYSDETSHRNTAENITISSFPTTISFTYDNGVGIKSVETPPADPAGKVNIGKYVNATSVTANSWLFLNVSYENEDVPPGMQESTLRMWRYNGTWYEVEGSGVNTTGNYVYANLTEFSIFAPLGNDPAVTVIPTATGTGNVTIETDKGYFCNETNALPASPPDAPALTFPHGFFNVTICGLNDTSTETVTINFTFPSAIPTNAEFWKHNSSNGTWYQYPFGSNDGDNVISITITDNGAGDHNPALGIIEDPNGIGWSAAAAEKVPALTPTGIIALVGLLSVIAAMSIRIRKKK
ncbi:MAG: choice-of-anchor U domain-containing protein [Euryarchaeota archaeon]|nr:choice-of-anchor U domain-containing protein [Euryarchaeota archaeon]